MVSNSPFLLLEGVVGLDTEVDFPSRSSTGVEPGERSTTLKVTLSVVVGSICDDENEDCSCELLSDL